MGPRCFSFPWPNVQPWRNVVSCDVRLVHEAVFESFFRLEARRISIWVAATRSQQTPGSSFHGPFGQLCRRAKVYRTSWSWAVSIRQASCVSMSQIMWTKGMTCKSCNSRMLAHRSALALKFFCCKNRLVANFKHGWQVTLTLAPVSAPEPNIFVRPNLAASSAVILFRATYLCSSFHWPNAQCWRNVVSCDERLIHVAVVENFFWADSRLHLQIFVTYNFFFLSLVAPTRDLRAW